MKTRAPVVLALAATLPMLPLAMPRHAAAQGAAAPAPPVLPSVPESETVTIAAKITAINAAKRWVTLASPSGERVTVVAGPAVRLNLLKVGDKVSARYVRSVAFVVRSPTGGNGVPTSDSSEAAILSQNVSGPGGIALRLTKISGTIVGINLGAHSLQIVDPSGGGIYTIDVTDPERIAKLPSLKVGDTVTAVITEALAVSIEPAPRGWF